MNFLRLFSTDAYKGTKNYLNTQKNYEIVRTILYFTLSLSLFFGGWAVTKSRMNLLTVVAVLGCLPASKSLVSAIMFLRQKSGLEENLSVIEFYTQGLDCLYDLVFTAYERTYPVAHLVVKGNTILGFAEDPKFDEQAFYKHIDGILKADHLKDITVHIFKNRDKYCERLQQIQDLAVTSDKQASILNTLKSVSL